MKYLESLQQFILNLLVRVVCWRVSNLVVLNLAYFCVGLNFDTPADECFRNGLNRELFRRGLLKRLPRCMATADRIAVSGRGVAPAHGRDWSVEAFLVSKEGLGLEIAQDSRTLEAMRRALPLLADATVESLRGRRLDSDDFDKLAVSDPIRDILRWMSDPDGVQKSLDAARWQSFCNVCKADFNFDPEEDDSSGAANSLSVGGGRWDDIWRRFCEAPRLYPGISDLLREPRQGQGKLSFEQSRSPRANEEAEAILRRELEGATQLPHHDLCEKILKLESEHGRRRDWVWAQLGESPLVAALEPISRLATLWDGPRPAPEGVS